MRTSTKRTFVALVAAAAAVTLLGAAAQGAAAPNQKPEGTHGTVDTAFLAQEQAAGRNVVSTKASRAALAGVQSRIAAYVAKNGTKYSFGSYSDPATGNVVVDTNAPSAVFSKLTTLAGIQGVAATKVAVKKTGAITDAYSRRDDVPAFFGGGGLLSGGFLCSTGYAVQNSAGTRFMVTAGHCFANGANVQTESNARSEGTVTGRALASLGSGAIDMELLTGQSYAGRIFTGGVTSSTSQPVVGAGAVTVGYNNYCHSGRTTGENCGHTATSATAQVCTETGCKSPVIAYTGGNIQQGGDSGGTFFVRDTAGNNIFIRGHVIASGGGTGYVEPWAQVQARYGVTVVTG